MTGDPQSYLNHINMGGSDWCKMMGHHWQVLGGVICCTNCWEERATEKGFIEKGNLEERERAYALRQTPEASGRDSPK